MIFLFTKICTSIYFLKGSKLLLVGEEDEGCWHRLVNDIYIGFFFTHIQGLTSLLLWWKVLYRSTLGPLLHYAMDGTQRCWPWLYDCMFTRVYIPKIPDWRLSQGSICNNCSPLNLSLLHYAFVHLFFYINKNWIFLLLEKNQNWMVKCWTFLIFIWNLF